MFRSTILAASLAIPFFVWQIFLPQRVPLNAYNILIFLIISPVAEELIFRGFLQEFLLRKLRNHALIISTLIVSILFTLAHVLIRQNISAALVFFPSLVLCAHYGRFRNLPSVVIIHAIYNIIVFL